MRRGQAGADGGESNEEEGDTEEEPRDGKDPDRGIEGEEQVPQSRGSEEHRANDVQLEVGLSVRTGEQDDLITSRAQNL